MYKVARIIRVFEKSPGERLVEEISLPWITADALQKIFGQREDDPEMYLSYQVFSNHQDVIESIARRKLDLDKYDYFIEADAIYE